MSSEPIEGRCAAHRADGTYCERWPLTGKRRCKKHYRIPPKAQMAGTTQNSILPSRYGKFIPPRLQDRYNVAIQDPMLLSTREDIALIDARLEDLLRRADTGESGRVWQRLKQAKTEMLSARQRKDAEGTQAALQEIMRLIDHGFGDHLTWEDIRSTVMDRTKLVRSEQKRLVDMHQMVTVERLVNFMQVLGQILLAEIPDKSVARRVNSRVQQMLHAGNPGNPS